MLEVLARIRDIIIAVALAWVGVSIQSPPKPAPDRAPVERTGGAVDDRSAADLGSASDLGAVQAVSAQQESAAGAAQCANAKPAVAQGSMTCLDGTDC
jgi:hypothetical protein